MATHNEKNKNISIVLKYKPVAPASAHQLPDIEGLTKEEMYRRPTSDLRQRRIAHVPRYQPVNKKRGKYLLLAPEEPKDKEDPPKKIKISIDMKKYMATPIVEKKIRIVDVPWAYKESSSSGSTKIKNKNKSKCEEEFKSNKKLKKSGAVFIL